MKIIVWILVIWFVVSFFYSKFQGGNEINDIKGPLIQQFSIWKREGKILPFVIIFAAIVLVIKILFF